MCAFRHTRLDQTRPLGPTMDEDPKLGKLWVWGSMCWKLSFCSPWPRTHNLLGLGLDLKHLPNSQHATFGECVKWRRKRALIMRANAGFLLSSIGQKHEGCVIKRGKLLKLEFLWVWARFANKSGVLKLEFLWVWGRIAHQKKCKWRDQRHRKTRFNGASGCPRVFCANVGFSTAPVNTLLQNWMIRKIPKMIKMAPKTRKNSSLRVEGR